jgi:acyl-CoA reductase-like NAD-dependent aldehyde dehydrogenase
LLAKRPGETLKRTTMELGGYNPMIILDDVDMDYAVPTATFGSFFHQGQICLNTRRIIVQRKIADEFIKKFAARTKTLPSGDPHDHKTIIGPLITPAAVKLCDDRVKEAVSKGTKLHTGGVFEGQIYQPIRDLAVNCVQRLEQTAELTTDERTRVMSGNAIKLFPRLGR